MTRQTNSQQCPGDHEHLPFQRVTLVATYMGGKQPDIDAAGWQIETGELTRERRLGWKIIQEGMGMAQCADVPGVSNNGSFRLCGLLWVSRWPNLQRYGVCGASSHAPPISWRSLTSAATPIPPMVESLHSWVTLPLRSKQTYQPSFSSQVPNER